MEKNGKLDLSKSDVPGYVRSRRWMIKEKREAYEYIQYQLEAVEESSWDGSHEYIDHYKCNVTVFDGGLVKVNTWNDDCIYSN